MLLFKTEDMAKSWRRHYNFYPLSSFVFWFCFLGLFSGDAPAGLYRADKCLWLPWLRLGRLGGLRGVIQLAFPVRAMLVRAGAGAAGGGDAGAGGRGQAMLVGAMLVGRAQAFPGSEPEVLTVLGSCGLMGDFRLGLGFWKPRWGILTKARFHYQKSVFRIFLRPPSQKATC